MRAGGYEVHAARFFAWWNVVSNGGRGEGTGAAGDLFMVCMGRARRGVAARGRRLAAVGGGGCGGGVVGAVVRRAVEPKWKCRMNSDAPNSPFYCQVTPPPFAKGAGE